MFKVLNHRYLTETISMLSTDKITEIYYEIDEFFKAYSNVLQSHSIESDSTKKKRNRKSTLNASGVMTILILFHDSGFRCLKHYYLDYVKVHMQKEFPKTVSYNQKISSRLCLGAEE